MDENKEYKSEKQVIEIHDIYENLWKCRDFELSHLWQRSIFLTAFLIGNFTVFISVIAKLFESFNDNIKLLFLDIIAYIICLIGIMLSCMWIKMGKGSKAWYEIYENAINAFSSNGHFFSEDARGFGGFNYPLIPGYKGIKYDSKIIKMKAGAYSVSKINIGIGKLFLYLWFIFAICHSILLGYLLIRLKIDSYWAMLICMGCLTIIGAITLWFGNSNMFKSSSIEDFGKSINE